MVSRLTLLITGLSLSYGFLIFNLYNVQLEKGEYYLARAESEHGLGSLNLGSRGSIYFTDKIGNKVPAVSNREFPIAYAVPKIIDDPEEAAEALAPVLGLEPEKLAKRFSDKKDEYELLGRKLLSDTAGEIAELNIKGIYVSSEQARYYPFGVMAAHLLGYVGPDNDTLGVSGHYGIEEYYDEELSGKGNFIDGKDMTLTIDHVLQREAERIIGNLVKNYNAKGASVVIEDPKTGKILAMASKPDFDPNAYQSSEIGRFLNPVTQEIYEPGSVFKVITMAAGIDSGKITPETTYNDTGELTLSGKTILNWDQKAHGTVTMTNVIEKSLNTGAAYAMARTGPETFTEYVKKFGFGEKTGIDLLSEAKGNIKNLRKNAPEIEFATASFGQGVAVSTIELANAFSAVANGGILMRPYLNEDVGSKEVRRVISIDTAEKVGKMMASALEKAEVAKIKGYALAGKTGTAQVPDLENGGYTDKVINTYAGFGPLSDPRFVIILKLQEPENAPLAGGTVVPAFRELAQFILNYYNIPPDKL